ncbi:MAG: RNA polymerase sigma factor [Mangrovibacterium sp.]
MNKAMIERKLVNQLKQGNESAFNALIKAYEGGLYNFVFALVKLNGEAEDIVQQTFIKVWLNRKSINSEMNFSTFLFTIAKNTALNSLRRIKNEKSYLRDEMWQSVELSRCFIDEKIEYDELLSHIQDALNNVSELKKEIFEMSRRNGMSYSEIGEKMGISKYTVKNHIAETIRLIRKEIENNKHIRNSFCILLLFFFRKTTSLSSSVKGIRYKAS